MKNIHGGVLLLVKFQASVFAKSNTLPWVFFDIMGRLIASKEISHYENYFIVWYIAI